MTSQEILKGNLKFRQIRSNGILDRAETCRLSSRCLFKAQADSMPKGGSVTVIGTPVDKICRAQNKMFPPGQL